MGQHLASAGDDKLIMVWKQVKNASGNSTESCDAVNRTT